jgi:hypothetical protein
MNGLPQIRCFAVASALILGSVALAEEPLELPREIEVLTIMPRVTAKPPAVDPAWLYRGSIRPGWAYPAAEGLECGTRINARQIELLRALDKLRPPKPTDDPENPNGDLGSIADKLGKPETLPIPPRVVK